MLKALSRLPIKTLLMIRTTGSITLSRVQLFINNFPFYCKLPQANGTLIKAKFDLCRFAVWQWQAAHPSAESTQLCSKMWQRAAQPTYPAAREETCLLLVQEARTARVFFKYTTTSTAKMKGTQESTDRSAVWPQLLALYSQVTQYSGPVSSLICSSWKISHVSSVLLLQATTVVILFPILDACWDLRIVSF